MEWRVRNVWKAWNYWVGIYINVDARVWKDDTELFNLIAGGLSYYIIGEEILTKNFSSSILHVVQKKKIQKEEEKDTCFSNRRIKSRICDTRSKEISFSFLKKKKKKKEKKTFHRIQNRFQAIVARSTVIFYDLLQVIWPAKPIKSNSCHRERERRYRGRYFLPGSQDSGSTILEE